MWLCYSTRLSGVSYSLVLDDTCLKDPGAFWGLSSDLFPEKQRGDADAFGAACCGISPPPGCGSDPRKKIPLPDSMFGRVWSCLVRITRSRAPTGVGESPSSPQLGQWDHCARDILFMVPVHDELFLHLVLIIPPYCSYSAAHLGTR